MTLAAEKRGRAVATAAPRVAHVMPAPLLDHATSVIANMASALGGSRHTRNHTAPPAGCTVRGAVTAVTGTSLAQKLQDCHGRGTWIERTSSGHYVTEQEDRLHSIAGTFKSDSQLA